MLVSDDKAAFTAMHLVFLGLDIHHCHLDFRRFDGNNSEIIPQALCLQLIHVFFISKPFFCLKLNFLSIMLEIRVISS